MKYTTKKCKGKGYSVIRESKDGRELGIAWRPTKSSARKYIRNSIALRRKIKSGYVPKGGW